MSDSLHELSREALIELARGLGLARPEVFTRAELQDEIVKRRVSDPKQQRRARGLLGLARDLLASVVEKGLHLPEIADKLRAATPPAAPAPREPVATVTLAEIYVAQGHQARARKVLEEVLAREPEHVAARALAAQLDQASRPAAAPEAPAPASASPVAASDAPQALDEAPRPRPMLDEAPLPRSYGVEEIVALPIDPTTTLVYWETRRAVVDTVIELSIEAPSGERLTRVLPLASAVGQHVARELPAGATVAAKLGARRDVTVAPRASTSVTVPPLAPSPRVASAFSRLDADRIVPLRAPPSPRFALALALASEPLVAPPLPRVGGSSEAAAPWPLGSSGLSPA